MPSKYVIRDFSENSFHHVFNRGVEKRKIFLEKSDYEMLIYYLYIYLQPIDKIKSLYPATPFRILNKNLSNEVELVAYCLMPNHFHLLLKGGKKDSISKFLKQLTNAYTFYFNNKYKRVGSLMQGVFKSVRMVTDEQLIHVSRYIHLNPIVGFLVKSLNDYKYSSFQNYNGKENKLNVKREYVIGHFKSSREYVKFVLDQESYAKELGKIKHLTLED